MHNVTGPPVVDDDLYGREYELARLWERLEQGEHVLMLAPRRVGKTSLMLELRRAPRKGWDVIYIDVRARRSAQAERPSRSVGVARSGSRRVRAEHGQPDRVPLEPSAGVVAETPRASMTRWFADASTTRPN